MDSQQQPLDRYQSLTDAEIAQQLRAIHNGLLMRGRLETLITRRQIGELLHECARRYPRDRRRFEVFALRTVGLEYSDARRHSSLPSIGRAVSPRWSVWKPRRGRTDRRCSYQG